MRKFAVITLFVAGAFFGLVWWFDVEQAGGSFNDFFSDPYGNTQSLFSRFGLWFQGMIENLSGDVGGQVDPVVLAAGLIAGFERFSAKAYPDPPGQTATYSIGYGHQIVPGDGFDTYSVISEPDALTLLNADLANFVDCVNNTITVPLNPQGYAALYSFTYNEGCGAFQGSTLLNLLNSGDYAGAQAEFAKWTLANGQVLQALVDRRSQEATLFAQGIPAVAVDTSDSGDQTA